MLFKMHARAQPIPAWLNKYMHVCIIVMMMRRADENLIEFSPYDT